MRAVFSRRRARPRPVPHRIRPLPTRVHPLRRVRASLCAGLVAAVPAAWAQSSNCDDFKAKVAERIEAGGVRGYALDIVPSSQPLAAGARSVGTCDGGAFTLQYRRWGGAAAAAAAPAVASAATATAAAPAVTPRATPAPTPTPSTSPAPRPSPTPSPAVSPSPAPAPSPAPVVSPAAVVAPAATVTAVALNTTEAPPVSPVAPPPAPAAEPESPPWWQRVADAGLAGWHWALGALGLLAALAGLRWHRHRSLYDESGLPRGPRITL